jgi:hypothetical protein
VRASLLVALLALSATVAAEDLGTLFLTQKEREALDRQRRGESATQSTIERPDPVVTGYVKRSDGKSTVFLDKRPYQAANPRIQNLLEPRIIERYEPIPLPAEPSPPVPASNGEAAPTPKSTAPAKAPVPVAKKPGMED